VLVECSVSRCEHHVFYLLVQVHTSCRLCAVQELFCIFRACIRRILVRKQAAATVAKLARDSGCKVTVLMIDKKGEDGDPAVKEETIRWHLNEGGCTDYDLLHREEEKPSVAVGDVADDLECDLVVLSAEAVHGGLVNANLLAEFVPCPIFMIP